MLSSNLSGGQRRLRPLEATVSSQCEADLATSLIITGLSLKRLLVWLDTLTAELQEAGGRGGKVEEGPEGKVGGKRGAGDKRTTAFASRFICRVRLNVSEEV